jgi:hypothetical protein
MQHDCDCEDQIVLFECFAVPEYVFLVFASRRAWIDSMLFSEFSAKDWFHLRLNPM